jgi:hypothetical protein
VKITEPVKQDGGKSYWTTVGSAWHRTDGTVSINLNDGVQLLLTKQVRIILAPIEEK